MNEVKIGRILRDIIIFVFLVVCIFSVFVTILSRKDADGAAEVFGYQMRVVTSDSMAACEHTDVSAYKIKDIPVRSMVLVEVMSQTPAEADAFYRSLQVGDVLTFRYVYTTQITITHRIISITEKDTGGFIIELAGDNKNSKDANLTQVIDTSVPNNTNYVIGKVVGHSYLLGRFMNFLKQPAGIVICIIVPCFIIIMLEVIKIVRIIEEDKRDSYEEY